MSNPYIPGNETGMVNVFVPILNLPVSKTGAEQLPAMLNAA